ncbi:MULTISPECIES: DUF937 domain-containing protein [Sphingobacterium]|uniref:DUF937 domain-containing protein n=1 Tax=Sphingobacterium litopenaei TaxID=2763500 RepID=A0ABR7YFC7_9SPHI|nr:MULTISPECIES: DUF937 domain-containing protein [Sphingobacterium]MBD1430023.1 DUF937 domain-containing protein [Sphingobacterium litopenaei]NGM74653.1 DUF937 domain-containing protein [Sphingobacterium sp. SGL-16]
MNITDLITGGIGSKAISLVAKTLNIDESKAKWVVAAAVPLMIAALNYNSKKSKEKEEGINKALEKHNGGIFDQIGNLFGNGPSEDDNKIVNHMFGSNTEVVKDNLAAKTGLSADKIGGALAILAPIVMGYLGKQKQQESSSGGIGDILGSVLGGGQSNSSAEGGILGSILGSVLGGGGSYQSSSQGDLGGLADLAGEFFNKGNDNSKKGFILDSLAGMFGR